MIWHSSNVSSLAGVSSIHVLLPQEAEIKAKLAGHPIDSIWLVGGSVLYSRAMETLAATHIYLTRIHKKFDCDTFFPEIDFKNYIEVGFQLTFMSSMNNTSCTMVFPGEGSGGGHGGSERGRYLLPFQGVREEGRGVAV